MLIMICFYIAGFSTDLPCVATIIAITTILIVIISSFIPILLIMVGSYIVASSCLAVYSVAVDTLFLCFLKVDFISSSFADCNCNCPTINDWLFFRTSRSMTGDGGSPTIWARIWWRLWNMKMCKFYHSTEAHLKHIIKRLCDVQNWLELTTFHSTTED